MNQQKMLHWSQNKSWNILHSEIIDPFTGWIFIHDILDGIYPTGRKFSLVFNYYIFFREHSMIDIIEIQKSKFANI